MLNDNKDVIKYQGVVYENWKDTKELADLIKATDYGWRRRTLFRRALCRRKLSSYVDYETLVEDSSKQYFKGIK